MSGKLEQTESNGGFGSDIGSTSFSTPHKPNSGSNMDQASVVAFVGHGVEFKGVIKYQGSVRIDGRLEGEVHAEGTLFLGEQAIINAKISAQSVISKGQITGDISAREKVQLLSPAIMDGSVFTPSLLIEEGVRFNGTLAMDKEAEVARQTSQSVVVEQPEKEVENLVLA